MSSLRWLVRGGVPPTPAPFSRQNTNDMVSCVSAMNGATNLQNIKVTYFSTKNMKCGFNVHREKQSEQHAKFSFQMNDTNYFYARIWLELEIVHLNVGKKLFINTKRMLVQQRCSRSFKLHPI